MRLESALYSSRSGIDAHGLAIGVVGDNIANASTTGYKAARSEFQDLFADGYDGRSSYAGPQVGSGTAIAAVRPIHVSGGIDQTGRELDAAIDGNGFFLVGEAANPSLTRDGAFTLSANGLLTTNTGQSVLGYAPGATELSPINMLALTGLIGEASTEGTIAGNLPANAPIATPPANPATFGAITSAASYQTTVDIYDSLGATHPITLSFYRTAPNSWTVQAHVDGSELQGGTAGTPSQLGTNTTITFSPNGTIEEANQAASSIAITPTFANGSAAGNITLNLGDFVQFAGPGSTTSVAINGKQAGRILSYEIEQDGTIQALLSTGFRAPLGTIVLGDVTNEDGLQRTGDNDFSQTTLSGTSRLLRPGEESAGFLRGGSLELSTTDISREFTNLVLIQRGYEANSKILNSTSDLMRQTIQLLG